MNLLFCKTARTRYCSHLLEEATPKSTKNIQGSWSILLLKGVVNCFSFPREEGLSGNEGLSSKKYCGKARKVREDIQTCREKSTPWIVTLWNRRSGKSRSYVAILRQQLLEKLQVLRKKCKIMLSFDFSNKRTKDGKKFIENLSCPQYSSHHDEEMSVSKEHPSLVLKKQSHYKTLLHLLVVLRRDLFLRKSEDIEIQLMFERSNNCSSCCGLSCIINIECESYRLGIPRKQFGVFGSKCCSRYGNNIWYTNGMKCEEIEISFDQNTFPSFLIASAP